MRHHVHSRCAIKKLNTQIEQGEFSLINYCEYHKCLSDHRFYLVTSAEAYINAQKRLRRQLILIRELYVQQEFNRLHTPCTESEVIKFYSMQ